MMGEIARVLAVMAAIMMVCSSSGAQLTREDRVDVPGAVAMPVTQAGTVRRDGAVTYQTRALSNERKPTLRIVNGNPVSNGDLEFVVSLHRSDGFAYCGGSLIAPDYVLTAAHCTLAAEQLTFITVGTTDNVVGGIKVNVEQVYQYKDYNDSNGVAVNDFAVLKLSENVTGITPIKLANSQALPKKNYTIAGFGRIFDPYEPPANKTADDSRTTKMMEAQVTVVEPAVCKSTLGTYGQFFNETVMICTDAKQKTDACQGDSGGPLFLGNVQYGVVSWGIGCASGITPGVYADVSSAYNWIQSILDNPDTPSPNEKNTAPATRQHFAALLSASILLLGVHRFV